MKKNNDLADVTFRVAVCEGKMCPKCFSHNVKNVGSNPDGINLNIAYDCLDCNAQWEGY